MELCVDIHCRIGEGRIEETRPVDAALREMDDAGVDKAWICPTDAYVAVRNREGNDFIANVLSEHPDRFVGCAVSNPWYGDDALTELKCALDKGLRVLFLCPPLQGFQLSDPLVDPLVELAVGYSAPIYAHTGTPICAMPFQFAALAERHPKGRFIMGHSGFSDFWYDVPHIGQLVENIWFDTSPNGPDSILQVISAAGESRVLFSSSAPSSDLSVELDKIKKLPVSDEVKKKILGVNAEALLS